MGLSFGVSVTLPLLRPIFSDETYQIVLAKNEFLFSQICLHLGKPACPRMKIPSMRRILKFRRNIREAAERHRAQK